MVHRLVGQKWSATICRGTGERREEGGGREAGTGKREGGERREGRKKDFPVVLGVEGVPLGRAFWAWDEVMPNRFRITCVGFRFFSDFLKSLGETKWKLSGFPI